MTVEPEKELSLSPEEEEENKPSVGRPRKIFTDAELRSIGIMAGYGMPIAQIAAILGISESTFYRNKKWLPAVKEAFDKGAARARLAIAKTLFEKATNERDNVALIWWEKTRYGMSEKREEQLEVSAEKQQNVAIYIPENNRD